jgi:hypothetical protein
MYERELATGVRLYLPLRIAIHDIVVAVQDEIKHATHAAFDVGKRHALLNRQTKHDNVGADAVSLAADRLTGDVQ